MNMRRIIIFTFLLILVLLMACTKELKPFTELSCKPPCWQGLTPGKTTKLELNYFLNSSSIIDKESILERDANKLFNIRTNFALTSGSKGGANFISDVLTEIFFNNKIDLSFNDAVKLYGEPKFLLIYTDMCNPTPFLTFGDPQCTQIHAFNPEIGINYGYQITRNKNIKIDKNANLTNIEFFDPFSYNDLLEGGAFFGLEKEAFLEHTIPWTGFGELIGK